MTDYINFLSILVLYQAGQIHNMRVLLDKSTETIENTVSVMQQMTEELQRPTNAYGV